MNKAGVKKGNRPWNKGTAKGWINKRGYHCIKVDGKEKKVHRLVMEEKIGRELLPSEDVHHKDGNKLNNHPDNLELLKHSEHTRITNRRPYKRGYKLNISEAERDRRSKHLTAILIKKAKGE